MFPILSSIQCFGMCGNHSKNGTELGCEMSNYFWALNLCFWFYFFHCTCHFPRKLIPDCNPEEIPSNSEMLEKVTKMKREH